MPGISRVIGPKAKNQQIFKSLKCGLRYLCVIAFFQQLDEICQIATTLIITVSSWHYTLASFWRYKAKIKILFFCEPSLWVEVSNDVLVPGFHCAYRASRGCNQQIFIRGDKDSVWIRIQKTCFQALKPTGNSFFRGYTTQNGNMATWWTRGHYLIKVNHSHTQKDNIMFGFMSCSQIIKIH